MQRGGLVGPPRVMPSPSGYRYYCCHFRLSFVDIGGQRIGGGGVRVCRITGGACKGDGRGVRALEKGTRSGGNIERVQYIRI